MFFLCLAVLVVATSAATVSKCEDKKVNKTDELIFKYSCHCNCYTLTLSLHCDVMCSSTDIKPVVLRPRIS